MTHNWPSRASSEWTDEESKADRLNVNAYLALDGAKPDVSKVLAALLRSDVPIHPAVRERLAIALEKGKAESGIRLEVRGEGSGKSKSLGHALSKRRDWLIIGKAIAEMVASGASMEAAKNRVRSIPGHDGSIVGCDAGQAANAWKFYQEYRAFYDNNPNLVASFSKIGVNAEWAVGGVFINSKLAPNLSNEHDGSPVE